MMELRELRTLLSLSETGSLAATAEALHLTPAAVHKQLKNLEAEWGVRFYEKHRRGLRLEPVTQALVPHLRDVAFSLNQLDEALQAWKGQRRAMLRLGTGPTYSAYILPAVLTRFREFHADVQLRIETGNTPVIFDALDRGDLDVAIVVADPEDTRRGYRLLLDLEFEIVPVRAHPAAKKLALRDLAQESFLLTHPETRLGRAIFQYCGRHGLTPRVSMRSDNLDSLKAMVLANLGVGFTPYWVVAADLEAGRLHRVPLHEPPLTARMAFLGRAQTSGMHPLLRSFLKLAREISGPLGRVK